MKTFTTVNEAVETAAQFGITASTIAEAIGMSRQNFHNKLKSNGSTFTAVHLLAVTDYLEETFTAVHEKVAHLLELKTFTQVNEVKKFTVVNESLGWDSYKAQKELEEMRAKGLLEPAELDELPW